MFLNDGNKVISDVTIRTLIVKGMNEVERIRGINQDKHIINVNRKSKEIYEIQLIYRVGDYFERG